MKYAYCASLALCLIGLGTRTSYEILKKLGKIDSRNPVIFAAVFVGMVCLLLSWVLMCPLDPWKVPCPVAVQGTGIVLLAAGPALAGAGLLQLRGVENIDHLVTTGVFSKIRHPMYTGFILWIAGWIISNGALLSLITGVVCAVNILYWRRLDEARLIASYQDEYLKYRHGTWF
jgi:protein-S-isoprenylcysteine O-methyltransferase Ste14